MTRKKDLTKTGEQILHEKKYKVGDYFAFILNQNKRILKMPDFNHKTRKMH